MNAIAQRVDDARLLWQQGRRESAFLLALVAVIVRARQDFPRPMGDDDAFRRYIKSKFSVRLSVEYHNKLWPVEDLFYVWFRCEIVHGGGLPIDIQFMDDAEPGSLVVRAGGAPEYVLLVSPGWFEQLIAWALA